MPGKVVFSLHYNLRMGMQDISIKVTKIKKEFIAGGLKQAGIALGVKVFAAKNQEEKR